MAVDQNFRNCNLGTEILSELLQHAKNKSKENVILHARENAVFFYQKNGFSLIKKTHLLYGEIQHYLMKILL